MYDTLLCHKAGNGIFLDLTLTACCTAYVHKVYWARSCGNLGKPHLMLAWLKRKSALHNFCYSQNYLQVFPCFTRFLS